MDLDCHSRTSQRQRYGSRFSSTNIAEAEGFSRDLKYFGREMPPIDSFPEALYKMVDDPSTDSVISWSQSGNSFVVWNESEFYGDVLLRFFPIRHFAVFVKMLNIHTFRKVEESGHQLEWAHASLVKGKPELSKPENFVITLPPPVDLEETKKRVAEVVLKKKEREAKKERRNKRVLKKEKEKEKEQEQEKEKEKEKEKEQVQVQVVERFDQSLIL